MLVESSGDIDGDTSVERVVGTENDIDGPVHGSIKSVEWPYLALPSMASGSRHSMPG